MPKEIEDGIGLGAEEISEPATSTMHQWRKRRDSAAVLPMAAVFLYVSPLLDLVSGAGTMLGIPVAMIYIFGIWFGLIAVTAWLGRRLLYDGVS